MSMVILLVVFIVFLFMCISYKKLYDNETASVYECGFSMNSEIRSMFSYRFFLIAILFLIFDVEIVLMLSVPYLFLNVYIVWNFMLFIFVLLLGLIYEYKYGSLDWL